MLSQVAGAGWKGLQVDVRPLRGASCGWWDREKPFLLIGEHLFKCPQAAARSALLGVPQAEDSSL